MVFSLVLATCGRFNEVKAFLESLIIGTYSLEDIEVIIVDQNDKIDLTSIVNEYKNKIKLIHIKSNVKGLSKNRNIGLEHSSGKFIGFPDDDCEYLPNTLEIINFEFDKNNVDLLLGRIVERDDSDSLRVWDKSTATINTKNFYKKCSSITAFFNKETTNLKFNENLGVGAYFGACEDADLIYRNCKKNLNVQYTPNIKIYHPHYNSNNNMSKEKIYSYGLGFGAMISENLDGDMIILFIKAQGYHFLKMLFYFCSGNFKKSKNSYISLLSRFVGVIKYRKRDKQEGIISDR